MKRKKNRVRILNLNLNLPNIVSAFRLIRNGFDVELSFEENDQVRISRGRTRAVIVVTVGWDYSLRSGVTITGTEGLVTEQIRHVIRSLAFSSSPQSLKSSLFKSRRSPSGNEADVDRVLESMRPFLVAPVAVPLFAANKFPRESEFFQRWLAHHFGLGGGYRDA